MEVRRRGGSVRWRRGAAHGREHSGGTVDVHVHHDNIASIGAHGRRVAYATAAEARELIVGSLALEEHFGWPGVA